MPQTRTYNRSFAGGEVSPEMWGRIDDIKFQTGAATMRNFIATPQGPAENRAGTAFVREVKDSTKLTRLIPFTFSTTQTMVLEMGAGYFRFHTQGATLGPGSPAAYNGATAYVVGDLVSSGGVNYYCIASTTGNAPPNATYWYALPSEMLVTVRVKALINGQVWQKGQQMTLLTAQAEELFSGGVVASREQIDRVWASVGRVLSPGLIEAVIPVNPPPKPT